MKGTALILAGGGGKGAYEIGVWKAMIQYGADRKITAVSGTSVGGLNGALFAQGDYQAAERIWLAMSEEKILTPGKKSLSDGIKEIGEKGILTQAADVFKEGIFTRQGLIRIIRQELDVNKIRDRQLPCYAACCNVTKDLVDYINITGLTQNDMETVLLATSALPGIFEPVKFGRCLYLDGGLKDNVPVRPLYNAGYREFLVIHLSSRGWVEEADFPGASISQIVPSEDQGDFMTGTLDFSGEGAARRLNQGYEDGRRFFEDFLKEG